MGLHLLFRRSPRPSLASEATIVVDASAVDRRRSSAMCPPALGRSHSERIPLTRQRSSPASNLAVVAASGSDGSPAVAAIGNAAGLLQSPGVDGYGSTAGFHRGRAMRSVSTVEHSMPRPCTGDAGAVSGGGVGRFLVVADCQSTWDRRRTSCGTPAVVSTGNCCPSSSSASCAGSDVMLRPPTPNFCGGDDDLDSVNQLQFGGSSLSPPMSPGGASITVGGGTPAGDGRFRFRYNRSFTFRRGTSTSSSGGTGTGSRRSSTSPDKGRRAVQVCT
jgi:hypothetical protein